MERVQRWQLLYLLSPDLVQEIGGNAGGGPKSCLQEFELLSAIYAKVSQKVLQKTGG